MLLLSEFVFVIQKGGSGEQEQGQDRFKEFREYCERGGNIDQPNIYICHLFCLQPSRF